LKSLFQHLFNFFSENLFVIFRTIQTGDMITADCVVVDNNEISSNESGLTGEPKDVRKSKAGDCFLLSSCLLTEGEGCRAVVIGIG
jgi:magnesium-transporting ATPase (P-type)